MTEHKDGSPHNLDFLPGRRQHDVGQMASFDGLVKPARYDSDSDSFVIDHALPRDARMDEDPRMVIEEAAATYSALTTYLVIGQGPVSCFGVDPKRKKAKISNTSAGPICLGKRSQVTAGQGFLIPANTVFELDTQEEVFVGLIPGYAGAPIAVGVFIERN